MQTLFQDARFGARLLVRNPGFAAMAVLALALGIGGSTAIFSAVSAVLLRPLPIPNAEHVLRIWENTPAFRHGSVSGPNFKDWRDQSTVFESLGALQFQDFNLTGEGEPERLIGAQVSRDLFRVFGIEPNVGRSFLPEEQDVGRGQVVILGHGLWQRRFGGDSEIIGKTITLNGKTLSVVGIIPERLRYAATFGLVPTDLWVPLGFEIETKNRGNHSLQVYGRLKPGVTALQATAEMETIARRLAEQYPDEQAERAVTIRPFREHFTAGIRSSLLVLLGAVTLVLLIACANVAGLLMARGAARQGEFAIRLALGASRIRLVRQLLAESLLLSLLGTGLGLLLSLWGIDLLKVGLAEQVSRVVSIGVDMRVLVFSIALSIVCSLLFGIWPALQASNTNLHEGLKEGAARATSGVRQGRARRCLVVGELALSLTLLAGAGLTVRSFVKLQQIDPGFNPKGLLTVRLALPESKYSEDSKVSGFYKELLERLQAMPGVTQVGVVNTPPFSRFNSNGDFTIEGRPPWKKGETPVTEHLVASPTYFRTMGIRLIKGREFTDRDNRESTPVVIINQSMVKRFFADDEPIGKRLRVGWASDSFLEIVGVVSDVKRRGLEDESVSDDPETYFPYLQVSASSMSVMVRTVGDPLLLADAVKSVVYALDANQPAYDMKTMEQVIADSIAERRFNVMLLCAFALIALVLAAVGIYGLMSYQVSQRTQEMGIRMALGAQAEDVQRLVLKEGIRLSIWGLGLGLVGTLAVSRTLRSLLYGIGESDPVTFIVVTGLLAGVALLATYVPARRASRIDPMVALRYE